VLVGRIDQGVKVGAAGSKANDPQKDDRQDGDKDLVGGLNLFNCCRCNTLISNVNRGTTVGAAAKRKY